MHHPIFKSLVLSDFDVAALTAKAGLVSHGRGFQGFQRKTCQLISGEYLNKGKPVFIEGRLQLDTWDDKQTGQKRSRLRVIAESMQLLGTRDNGARSVDRAPRAAESSAPPQAASRRDPDLDAEPQDIPF
jgi:hypothetical protein